MVKSLFAIVSENGELYTCTGKQSAYVSKRVAENKLKAMKGLNYKLVELIQKEVD